MATAIVVIAPNAAQLLTMTRGNGLGETIRALMLGMGATADRGCERIGVGAAATTAAAAAVITIPTQRRLLNLWCHLRRTMTAPKCSLI